MNVSHRFAHIDAMRGLAALLVVCIHVSEVFITLPMVNAQGTLLFDIAHQLNFGHLGVLIFFAISGFVIPSSLRGSKRSSLKKFVIRRFFRLYPAFWFSILLALPSVWWLWERPITATLVYTNLTMLPTIFGSESILGLYWTLETELVFYTLCVALFVMNGLDKSKILFLASSIGILVLAGFSLNLLPKPNVSQWILMPLHLAVMFYGAIIRQFYENRSAIIHIIKFEVSLRWFIGLLAFGFYSYAFAACGIYFLTNDARFLQEAIAFFITIPSFLLLVFVFPITYRLFVWLGKISYSLYLLHPVVFYPLRWWIEQNPNSLISQMPLSLYLMTYMGLSIGLAWIAYVCIEAPAIALGSKYSTE